MKVSLADHGMYYRGLLILIRTDHAIDNAERAMMMRIGRALRFEESFCAEAIREILDNEFIPDDPPRFSDPEIARSFIRDGIRLALVDGNIDQAERTLLNTVAGMHHLDENWVTTTIDQIMAEEKTAPAAGLDAENIQWT
jgi:uncharacterized membrane protein YebE (DUF533 family)